MKYLILICLFFVACGESSEFSAGDHQFRTHYSQFVSDSIKHDKRDFGPQIEIKFYEGSEDIDHCDKYNFVGDVEKVLIDPEQWASLGFFGRKALIYHELGHCLLNRAHDNSKLSLMNSEPWALLDGSETDDIYISELFGGGI